MPDMTPYQQSQVNNDLWKRMIKDIEAPLPDSDRESMERANRPPEEIEETRVKYPDPVMLMSRGYGETSEVEQAAGNMIQVANNVSVPRQLVEFVQKAKSLGFDVSTRKNVDTLLTYHADPSLKAIVGVDLSDHEFAALVNYIDSSLAPQSDVGQGKPVGYFPQASDNLVQVLKYAVDMGLPVETKGQALDAIIEFLSLSPDDLYESTVYNELLRIPTNQYEADVYPSIVKTAFTMLGNLVDHDHLGTFVRACVDLGFNVSDKTRLLATVYFNSNSKLIKDAHLISDADYDAMYDDIASKVSVRMAGIHTAAYSMESVTKLLDVLKDMGFAIDNQQATVQVLSLLKAGGGYAAGLADHSLKVIQGSDQDQYDSLIPRDTSPMYEQQLANPPKVIKAPPPVRPLTEEESTPDETMAVDEAEDTQMAYQRKLDKRKDERKQRQLEKDRDQMTEKGRQVSETMLENRGMPKLDQLTHEQMHGATPPSKVKVNKPKYTPPSSDYVNEVLGKQPAVPEQKQMSPESMPGTNIIETKEDDAKAFARNKKPLMKEWASQYEDAAKQLKSMSPDARVTEWNDSLRLPIYNETGKGPDVARGGMFVFNAENKQEGMIVGALDRDLVVVTFPNGDIELWNIDAERIHKSREQIRNREASLETSYKMASIYVAQQMPVGGSSIEVGMTINDPNNPQSTGKVEEVKQDGTLIYTDNSGQKVTTLPNTQVDVIKTPNDSMNTVTHNTDSGTPGVGGPDMTA